MSPKIAYQQSTCLVPKVSQSYKSPRRLGWFHRTDTSKSLGASPKCRHLRWHKYRYTHFAPLDLSSRALDDTDLLHDSSPVHHFADLKSQDASNWVRPPWLITWIWVKHEEERHKKCGLNCIKPLNLGWKKIIESYFQEKIMHAAAKNNWVYVKSGKLFKLKVHKRHNFTCHKPIEHM